MNTMGTNVLSQLIEAVQAFQHSFLETRRGIPDEQLEQILSLAKSVANISADIDSNRHGASIYQQWFPPMAESLGRLWQILWRWQSMDMAERKKIRKAVTHITRLTTDFLFRTASFEEYAEACGGDMAVKTEQQSLRREMAKFLCYGNWTLQTNVAAVGGVSGNILAQKLIEIGPFGMFSVRVKEISNRYNQGQPITCESVLAASAAASAAFDDLNLLLSDWRQRSQVIKIPDFYGQWLQDELTQLANVVNLFVRRLCWLCQVATQLKLEPYEAETRSLLARIPDSFCVISNDPPFRIKSKASRPQPDRKNRATDLYMWIPDGRALGVAGSVICYLLTCRDAHAAINDPHFNLVDAATFVENEIAGRLDGNNTEIDENGCAWFPDLKIVDNPIKNKNQDSRTHVPFRRYALLFSLEGHRRFMSRPFAIYGNREQFDNYRLSLLWDTLTLPDENGRGDDIVPSDEFAEKLQLVLMEAFDKPFRKRNALMRSLPCPLSLQSLDWLTGRLADDDGYICWPRKRASDVPFPVRDLGFKQAFSASKLENQKDRTDFDNYFRSFAEFVIEYLSDYWRKGLIIGPLSKELSEELLSQSFKCSGQPTLMLRFSGSKAAVLLLSYTFGSPNEAHLEFTTANANSCSLGEHIAKPHPKNSALIHIKVVYPDHSVHELCSQTATALPMEQRYRWFRKRPGSSCSHSPMDFHQRSMANRLSPLHPQSSSTVENAKRLLAENPAGFRFQPRSAPVGMPLHCDTTHMMAVAQRHMAPPFIDNTTSWPVGHQSAAGAMFRHDQHESPIEGIQRLRPHMNNSSARMGQAKVYRPPTSSPPGYPAAVAQGYEHSTTAAMPLRHQPASVAQYMGFPSEHDHLPGSRVGNQVVPDTSSSGHYQPLSGEVMTAAQQQVACLGQLQSVDPDLSVGNEPYFPDLSDTAFFESVMSFNQIPVTPENINVDKSAAQIKGQQLRLMREPIAGITFVAERSHHWNVNIVGPKGSIFEDDILEAQISFPPHYPHEPPRFSFTTPIRHTDINQQGELSVNAAGMSFDAVEVLRGVLRWLTSPSLANNPATALLSQPPRHSFLD